MPLSICPEKSWQQRWVLLLLLLFIASVSTYVAFKRYNAHRRQLIQHSIRTAMQSSPTAADATHGQLDYHTNACMVIVVSKFEHFARECCCTDKLAPGTLNGSEHKEQPKTELQLPVAVTHKASETTARYADLYAILISKFEFCICSPLRTGVSP